MQSVVPTVALYASSKQEKPAVKPAVKPAAKPAAKPGVPAQVTVVKKKVDTIEDKLQRMKMPEWAKGEALKRALHRQYEMEVRFVRVLRVGEV